MTKIGKTKSGLCGGVARKILRAAMAPANSPAAVTMLLIEPTLLCDCRCVMCYNMDLLNPPAAERLTMTEIEAVAKQLPNLVTLYIGGGEPTLHPDLPGVISLFEKHASPLFIAITTNGLKPERVARAIDGVCRATSAQVVAGPSIDGVGEIHDQVRGVKGAFEALQETFKLLRDLSRRHGNLKLTAHTTICAQNHASIRETVDWVKKEWPEVEGHSIGPGWNPDHPDAALVDLDALQELCFNNPTSREGLKSLGILSFLYRSFYYIYPTLSREFRSGQPRRWRCSALRGSLVVDGKGYVTPCKFLPAIGRLRDHDSSLASILSEEEARRVRGEIGLFACHCDLACETQHSMSNPWNWRFLLQGAIRSLRHRL